MGAEPRLKRFFFDPTIGEPLHTNNEAIAWAAFHACTVECELYDNETDELLADKMHQYNEHTDSVELEMIIYSDEELEYVEL